MSISVPEPGILLGGRYRLEDQHGAGRGWAAWKATDEKLRRAVTVLTFSSGCPRIADTMTAARAAGRLTDPRLARVFDMAGEEDHPYVVTEWVGGDSLDDLLAGGPMDPLHAAGIIAQSAEALAAAHAAGLAHLCLNPGSLRWTAAGLKIVGLGTDAALAGVTADDPAATDTQALGSLLYGALTGRWPGGTWPSLPAAPQAGGHSYRPRQVQAGVPTALDEVCCRALSPAERGRSRLPPVTTPARFASALTLAIPASAPGSGRLTVTARPGGSAPARPKRPRQRRARRGSRPALAARLLASITAVLLMAAAAVLVPGTRGAGLQRPGYIHQAARTRTHVRADLAHRAAIPDHWLSRPPGGRDLQRRPGIALRGGPG
jgi:hypothetical protein